MPTLFNRKKQNRKEEVDIEQGLPTKKTATLKELVGQKTKQNMLLSLLLGIGMARMIFMNNDEYTNDYNFKQMFNPHPSEEPLLLINSMMRYSSFFIANGLLTTALVQNFKAPNLGQEKVHSLTDVLLALSISIHLLGRLTVLKELEFTKSDLFDFNILSYILIFKQLSFFNQTPKQAEGSVEELNDDNDSTEDEDSTFELARPGQ